jgi:hypothetical protein
MDVVRPLTVSDRLPHDPPSPVPARFAQVPFVESGSPPVGSSGARGASQSAEARHHE